jgi:hypothetical protein
MFGRKEGLEFDVWHTHRLSSQASGRGGGKGMERMYFQQY